MTEHVPVMMKEVLEGLKVNPDGLYWDGTFGRGGHSGEILALLGPHGKLIATDRDETAEQAAGEIDDSRFEFRRGSLSDVIDEMPQPLTGLLWDLGCSTPQLKDAERGFSFKEDGPLDMRMDQSQTLTAADIVNETPETELANLIYEFGEERLSRRIARWIVERRQESPIEDTQTLANICRRAYPKKYHRIDPATRTFQALRIVVNDELGQIRDILPKALDLLGPGGRAVIISFHSLEDRIVKHQFRDLSKGGGFRLITKKPLVPNEEESRGNPAARSSKLRIIERELPDNGA